MLLSTSTTTQLNGPQAGQPGPGYLPITPAYAKRLTALLGAAGGTPVQWQGGRLLGVQRKRHPYDEWTTVDLPGNINAGDTALRYRAVVQFTQRQAPRLTQH